MKAQELKKLIREEVQKTVNEAAITLPKDFEINKRSSAGNVYTFEYRNSEVSPTVEQAKKIEVLLRKEFAKIADKIQAKDKGGEITILERAGAVSIGFTFTTKLEFDDLDAMVQPRGINDYDYYY